MAKAESTSRGGVDGLNVDYMRSLVKQYSELGLWTSALFWADAAAAAGSGSNATSGDDVWLLASAMLARGEYHRAAYAVTSRGLHKHHLLCLGVAMRAYLAAQEAATALALFHDCDPAQLEPRTDITHNRALAGVLVSQARALSSLERRDAASEALCSALRADCACVEALALLRRQRALTHKQELELIESLPISGQLGAAEGALLRAAYRDRVQPQAAPPDTGDPVQPPTEYVRSRTAEASICLAKRRAAACDWAGALRALDLVDPWCCTPVKAACLVELKKSAELFAFAHTLVDAYPNSWTSWFAVGCYYYLIGKNELARRYLSKAKSLEPGAGCAWLAQGHSFAADNEHDQAMAAYFKASQLMAGSHLPPLYVGVECALLNNFTMCERFLLRAASLHSGVEPGPELVEELGGAGAGWDAIARVVLEPHVAHEAGCAAFHAGSHHAARALWETALSRAPEGDTMHPRWAATLDAMGHACRKLGNLSEALEWHERALVLRPGRAATYAARGLCLALLGREREAADALHTALAKDPDDVVALALLDAIVDRLDAALTGKLPEALEWPELALVLRPERAATYAARGLCVALLGREREAADALHTALAKDPDDVVALALLDAIVDRLDAALTGKLPEALEWPELALVLRPERAATYAARGLCLALLGREREAADALHTALAKDPDDVVALVLLDAIVDRLDAALTEEEIPPFPFGPVEISLPPAGDADATDHSDMSMSFELSMTGND